LSAKRLVGSGHDLYVWRQRSNIRSARPPPYCAPDDFTSLDRRLIFNAMLQLWNGGKPVDLVHLEHQLRTDGQWAGVGEPGLAQLVQGGAVWERTADYARLVRDASERRRAVKHMETVAARLREFTEQTDECMAAAIEGLLAMQARGRSCPHQGTKRLAAILVVVASNIFKSWSLDRNLPKDSTPFIPSFRFWCHLGRGTGAFFFISTAHVGSIAPLGRN
jgi:replicative DNA helicase